MGLFKTFRELRSQAKAAAQATGDPESQFAYAQLGQRLAQSGIEARGVIHEVRQSETQIGGTPLVEFDVSIKPPDGDPYQTTIKQAIPQDQLEKLSDGTAITVRYDPEFPTSALIYSW